MEIKATTLFTKWANNDKDIGMAKAHEPSVSEILNKILSKRVSPFSFIDAGCGNGWVVRKVRSMPSCVSACGIDGAEGMIDKAFKEDPKGEYYLDNLISWSPEKKVDIVHSMEVFYYFKDPEYLTRHIVENWLKPNGTLVIGLDHYIGNPDSYSWSADLNVHMSLLSEEDWINIFIKSGLKNCNSWKANSSKTFPGTLVISGDLN